MRKKTLVIFLLLTSVLLSVFLCGCTDILPSEQNETVTLSSISVVESTVPTDAQKGNIDVSQIQLLLKFSNGDSERITLDESMLTEESRQKLDQVGTQLLTVVFQNKVAKFQMEIHDVALVYYTLRIYGGVPTYIDGKKIVNPIKLVGDYYENVYLDGTEVTIEWVDVEGQNFSYWTANDLQVSTHSIVTATVDTNLVYRSYYSASVCTVSFKTFSSVVLQSKTVDVLYETDIAVVSKDNYIFNGWTTDSITETQSLNGYSKNIVKFPYYVGRDITFHATWIPMGVEYTLVGEHYEITGYSGESESLELPTQYNGLPVTVLRANAFTDPYADKLRFLTLSSALTEIEDGAFNHCTHLEAFAVSGSDTFKSVDGVLCSSDGSTLIAYPQNALCAGYRISSGVKTIRSYAFYNAIVGEVKLPSGVERVGYKAFDSIHIDHVDLSELVPTGLVLAEDLFNDYLQSLVLSESDKELFLAFFPVISRTESKVVTDVVDTNRVYSVEYEEGDGTDCSLLYRIIHDKNLVDATLITEDKDSYATAEIIGCYRCIKTFSVPIRMYQGGRSYTVTSLADYALKDCSLLNNVLISFSSKLERIGDNVFSDTPWLKTVGDTLSANDVVYKYLGSADVYDMDENVVKIAEGAFRNNSTLKYVNIGTGISLKTIAQHAFENCTSFIGFICDANPEGDGLYLKYPVKTIGEYAFYNTAVTYVKLQPSSQRQSNMLSDIGEYAFGECKYLKSVMLSRSTVNIASTAFIRCISLQEFVLSENNPTFRVYEGILYSYNNSDEHTLYCYPAGRMDGEFDPSYVRLYGYSLELDLSEYQRRPETIVGSIQILGLNKNVYLNVCTSEEWEKTYDIVTERYILQTKEGRILEPCTSIEINPDGSLQTDGDFYYTILDDDSTSIPLIYDKEKDLFYYYPTRKQFVTFDSLNLSLYINSGDANVGSATISDKVFLVYIYVKDGIEVSSSVDSVPVRRDNGQKLKQTTTVIYNDDGSVNEDYIDGEFYYYFFADADRTKKVVLLYDSIGGYYYEDYLNVTAIGSYAFSYSNIAAVKISAMISSIGENAFSIPGMIYVRFMSNPAIFSYSAMFMQYEPDSVILSDNLSNSDKMLFFDNDIDLMNEKVITPDYTFFTDDFGDDVLYALKREGNNSYLFVVRSDRNAESIVLPERVTKGGVNYTQVKTISPYAFYGVYIKSVTLHNVATLASHAFSDAYSLTKLFIETSFISDLQSDTFGETFHNGLFIYDSQNGFNLYRENENWLPAERMFAYYDADNMEYNGARYLILGSEQLPFAVVTYEDSEGAVKTAEICYGNITENKVHQIQQSIARAGWNISGWLDDDGEIIPVGSDYVIPYNQILSCRWTAQTYTLYFVVSEGEVRQNVNGVLVTLPLKRNSTTGLVTYMAKVTYGQPYCFELIGYDTLRKRFLRWKDNDVSDYQYNGTWETVLSSGELYLYPVMETRLYELVYHVDEDVTISVASASITYSANQFTLAVPTTPTYEFMGWYMLLDPAAADTAENRLILTDANGRSKISWLYTDRESFTLYALWDSVLLYPYGVGINSDKVRYGESYRLAVPEEDDFDGWYVEGEDGSKIKITDKEGVGYSAWSFDGKREYALYRNGND